MSITLIGLGVSEGDLSLRGKRALDNATTIFARTSLTSSYSSLKGYNVTALDELFLNSRNFDTLNKKLAKRILDASKEGDVVYCVDGCVSEDIACSIIRARKKDVIVIEGVSKAVHALSLVKTTKQSYTGISAYDIASLKSCTMAVIYDIDSDYTASLVKAKLSDVYGEEVDCYFVRGDSVKKIKVYEIDRQKKYAYDCTVLIEEGDFIHKQRYDYSDVERLIGMLRMPGGCPWDRAQTNESICKSTIEEAYELVDAINRGDDDDILEEIGDLILQTAFHSVIKSEQGIFNGTDAITHLIKKLIFRHSHIFGTDKAGSEQDVNAVWEKNKAIEKQHSTYGESILAVPNNFPACMRAQKVQKRAAKSGMDFASALDAAKKLAEEVEELIQALTKGDNVNIQEESGDVLFSALNVVRLSGEDGEEALNRATNKFIERFVLAEQLALNDGKKLNELDELQIDWYYLKAKNELKEH